MGHTEFKGNRGFLYRFCRRYNVWSKKMCGESIDCPDTDSFLADVLPPLLEQYPPEDIFNVDDTAFAFKLLPQRTYAFKGEQVSGSKTLTSKDHLTLLLCTNMTGTQKLQPLLIGKAKNPQVLKRYNMTVKDLPVDYYGNTKGWMTGLIFDDWLKNLNQKLLREKRKILLLVGNAPCHIIPEDLTNIKVQFLPPNTTCKLQPLDQGIIRVVKLYYRKMIALQFLDGIENHEHAKDIMKTRLNLKIACDMLVNCWNKVTPTLIQNCFRKAGFLASEMEEVIPEPAPDRNVWDAIQQALNVDLPFDTYATADDGLETTEHPTDDAILDEMQGKDEDDLGTQSDNDESEQNDNESDAILQSSNQVLCVTPQICAFLQRNKLLTTCIDDLEQLIIDNRIKSNTKQSSITSYLHS